MIEVKLNKDNSLKEIIYPQLKYVHMPKNMINKLFWDLKEIERGVCEIQNQYKCFSSDNQLEDEIVYAQLKYMSHIEVFEKIKDLKNDNAQFDKNVYETFLSLTQQELYYYLSWRTHIIHFNTVSFNSKYFVIFQREFICGTIDNSYSVVKNAINIFGDRVYCLENYYKDIQMIKTGSRPSLLNCAYLGEWKHNSLKEYYLGNFEYQSLGVGICEFLRNGTGFQLSSSFLRKYNLKDIFIEIVNEVVKTLYYWKTEENITFNDTFIAKKIDLIIFYNHHVSYEFINRIYKIGESPYCYTDDFLQIKKWRKLLFLLIENGIRKVVNYKELNINKHHFENWFNTSIKNGRDLKEIDSYYESLSSKIYEVIEHVINGKYITTFQKIKTEQNLINSKRLLIKSNKELDNNSSELLKKKTPREKFIENIKQNYSFEEAINLYKTFGDSFQKRNKGFFYTLLFGLWIINEDGINYEEFVKSVGYDKENMISKSSLKRLDSIKFLDYIKTIRKIYQNDLLKKCEEDLVNTCLTVAYYLFYLSCKIENSDGYELLLGKKITKNWDIFGDYIKNEMIIGKIKNCQKNVLGLEQYKIISNLDKVDVIVIRPSYSMTSISLIAYINISILEVLYDYYHISTKGIKNVDIDYSEYKSEDLVTVKKILNTFNKNLKHLLHYILEQGVALKPDELDLILKVNSVKSLKIQQSLPDTVFFTFFKSHWIPKKQKYETLYINYNCRYNLKQCLDARKIKHIKFQKKYFSNNTFDYEHELDALFKIEQKLDYNYQILSSDLMFESELEGSNWRYYIKRALDDKKVFQQWILRIEQGEIIIPKNKIYIYLLYTYFINGFSITSKGKIWNLIVLIKVWNYEMTKKDDQGLDKWLMYFLELIYDYYLIYCQDLSFREFKSYFCCDLSFEGDKYFPLNISDFFMDKNQHSQDIMNFYNSSMNYKYLSVSVSVFPPSYTSILISSLKLVEENLAQLWRKYNLNFYDYLLIPPLKLKKQKKILFYRIMLLDETREKLNQVQRINHKGFNRGEVEMIA